MATHAPNTKAGTIFRIAFLPQRVTSRVRRFAGQNCVTRGHRGRDGPGAARASEAAQADPNIRLDFMDALPDQTRGPAAIHVVLVHPEIHWNTGNAGRTCLAAGATLHLIEPLGFSLDERQVRRAGLDYWPHVDLRVWPDWATFEKELPALGEPYFFSTKARRLMWDAPLGQAGGVVLVFGRETGGLPSHLHERYGDRFLTLPIAAPQVRSLNLSTTVGIAVYEVLRQRSQYGIG